MPFRPVIRPSVALTHRGNNGKPLRISIWQSRFWKKTIVKLRTIKTTSENCKQTNKFHEKHA